MSMYFPKRVPPQSRLRAGDTTTCQHLVDTVRGVLIGAIDLLSLSLRILGFAVLRLIGAEVTLDIREGEAPKFVVRPPARLRAGKATGLQRLADTLRRALFRPMELIARSLKGLALSVEGLIRTELIVAPIYAGSCVIGFVDRVNGPSSRLSSMKISRFEARLLAKHWVKRIVDIHFLWSSDEQVGSRDMREESYAHRRLRALSERKLVTREEIESMFAEAKKCDVGCEEPRGEVVEESSPTRELPPQVEVMTAIHRD